MQKIFVSSTFRDMDFERDVIHKYIQPQLNAEALSYGENVELCDLRWGVDTVGMDSINSSKKVLEVCFDEIDNCRPYMIVLLGNRYGWIPDNETYSSIVGDKFTPAEDVVGKSITALEIEYGALEKRKLSRTLFYFREFEGDIPEEYKCESQESEKKLNELKERIRNLPGANVKTYRVKWNMQSGLLDGLDEFKEQLLYDLQTLLKNEWEDFSKLSDFCKNQRQHWNYAKQKNMEFFGRQDVVNETISLIKNNQILEISGDIGSGKSCLMGHLAFEFGRERFIVLPIFCGLTPNCSTVSGIVQYMIDYFERTVFGIVSSSNIDGFENNIRKLQNYFVTYQNTGKRLIILIDAIDQLVADDERDNLRFLPRENVFNIKVVISHNSRYSFKGSYSKFILECLERTDIAGIVKKILKTKSKELDDEVIELIQQKKSSDNPLYLRMVVQMLLMLNRIDFEKIRDIDSSVNAIQAYELELVRMFPEDLEEACYAMIQKVVSFNSELYEIIINILSLSRYGLRETDIECIVESEGLEWNRLEFACLMNYMGEFIRIREDGRYDFAHNSFRTAVNTFNNRKEYFHCRLVCHFRKLDIADSVKQLELPYHCFKSNSADDLMLFIKDVIMTYEDAEDVSVDENILDIISSNVYELMIQDQTEIMQKVCDLALEDVNLYESISKFINKFMIKKLGYTEEQILPMYYVLLRQMASMQASIDTYLDKNIVYYMEHRFKSIYCDSKVPRWVNKENVRLVYAIVPIICDIYYNISKCMERLRCFNYEEVIECQTKAIMLLEVINDAELNIGVEYFDENNTNYKIQLSRHYEYLAHYYVLRNNILDRMRAKKLLNEAIIINFGLVNDAETRHENHYHRLTETYLILCELLACDDSDKTELEYANIIAEKCLHIRQDILCEKQGTIEVLLILSKICEARRDMVRCYSFAKAYFTECKKLLDIEKKYDNYVNLVNAYRRLIELNSKYGDSADSFMMEKHKNELAKLEEWICLQYGTVSNEQKSNNSDVCANVVVSVPNADCLYWKNKKKCKILKHALNIERIIVLFSFFSFCILIFFMKSNRVDYGKIDMAICLITFSCYVIVGSILALAVTKLYKTRSFNYYIEKIKDVVNPD